MSNRSSLGKSLEIKRLISRRQKLEAAPVRPADRIEHRVHPHCLDFVNLRHQLAKPPLGKATLLEPEEIDLRQVHDRNPSGRVGLDSEFAEWDPRLADLNKESAEILAINFGNVGHEAN